MVLAGISIGILFAGIIAGSFPVVMFAVFLSILSVF